MMTLTAAQINQFFEQEYQMGIPHKMVVHIKNEGITTVDDLSKFDKGTIDHIDANIWLPEVRIPNPNPKTETGTMISTTTFVFGSKSQKGLVIAARLVQYYEIFGRNTTIGKLLMNQIHKKLL